jgi:hypothetical protein
VSYLALAHTEARKIVEDLAPKNDELYVLWREQFPYEALVRPLDDLRYLATHKGLSLSTVLATPFADRRLREFQIDDLYRAIYQRGDVFLVSNPLLNEYFTSYVAAHDGVQVSFTQKGRFRGRYVRADVFQGHARAAGSAEAR